MIDWSTLTRSISRQQGSIQARLTLLTALGVALSVLAIGLGTYLTARTSLYSQLDRELTEVASYALGPVSADVESMGGLNASALQASNATLFLVRADGVVSRVQGLRATVDPGDEEIAIARTQEGYSVRSAPGNDGGTYRLVAFPLSTDSGHYAMVIGRPLGPTKETLKNIRELSTIMGAFFAVLAGVFGYSTGRRVMRPLNELSSAVTRVIETDQLEPIGIYTDDELGDLSRSFDTMMASLDKSRERQRRLIADASHELRTPLTSMRTNVELLVADQKSKMLPEEARETILGDVAAQLGEFSSLVGDLVQLSRDEPTPMNPEPVDFATVVDHAVTRAKRRGPTLFFEVNTEPYFIIGQPDTLGRAVTNLLDNAVKFSPRFGTIHVSLHGGELVIWDEGPGIDEDDLPKIFDRFFRSDKARNTPGTGLGLSIVSHTIEAHGGTVRAENQPGAGARFIVTLPEAPRVTGSEQRPTQD